MSQLPDSHGEAPLTGRVTELPPLQRALLALESARSRIDELERAHSEPIAVVGIGCRLPGAVHSPDDYWKGLLAGFSGTGEIPPDRWDIDAYYDADPDAPGKMATRYAALIEGVDQFDAALFGISPREAGLMDPQQRLLLEVAWEALEHAGIAPDALAGSATGVYVGVSTNEYLQAALKLADPTLIGPHAGTGNALSVTANRLSYLLGLVGPSMAIDTACSSSLVAVHLACQSLRSGESDLALAGGVNLLLVPETMINFSRARMLSPDGLCKTFDAAADGYVRGEGCGVIVLRRLSDALADGDDVLAVIRGSAVNQDGRSNGLTAPNGPSQEEVIARALSAAGVGAAEIGYVEAHGTGTPLGDPIELRALSRALAAPGRERPLVVGSVKTNIGHLESAAGIAGLIKAILTVGRGVIPPHRNFTTPNPHVDFAALGLAVPSEATPFPAPRMAGVSSFGFGGTNAHVVVAEPPIRSRIPAEPISAPVVVKVSGRDEAARAAVASRLGEYVTLHPEHPLTAVAWGANVGRADLASRAVVTAHTHDELAEALRAVAEGRRSPNASVGTAPASNRARTLFVVPGQGTNAAGALAGLYGSDPFVTETLDELALTLGPTSELPLRALLVPDEASGEALALTEHAQPCLYALAVSLARFYAGHGIVPDVLLGHSVGAYAAAAIAGVMSLGDGARLVAERGRIMARLAPGGRMAAVFAAPEVVTGSLAPTVSLAAVNAASQCVISGPGGDVETVLVRLGEAGITTRPLEVRHAFHSALVEPALPELAAVLGTVALAPPHTTLLSDTTGERVSAEAATPDYWLRHARATTNFLGALTALGTSDPPDVVIELGPGTTALSLSRQTLGEGPAYLASLRADHSPAEQLSRTLAEAWSHGHHLDWRKESQPPALLVHLPTYPFQRRSHWLPVAANAPLRPSPGLLNIEHLPEEFHEGEDVPSVPDLAARLLDTPKADRRPLLVAHLQQEIARAIGVDDPSAIDPTLGLFDLGLDSLLAVELHARLQRALDRQLPATLAIDYPTVSALADYLLDENLLAEASGRSARPPVRGRATDAVAIAGMACRFPGGADSLEAFWRLVRDGVDASSEVPESRWDVDAFYDADPEVPGKSYTRRGNFLAGPIDGFDAAMFGISPREAAMMDPQQRLLLEVAWEALEDAGLAIGDLGGTRTGVFVGINTADYQQLLSAGGLSGMDAYAATGNTASVAAGRISYLLGLQGPAIALDTACSSSLVALHLACQSLDRGECDLALVGGVNLQLSPATTISMAKLRALSPDGRCKAFSAAADGYGRGEGCGVIVLERAASTAARGGRAWATVRGSAVNQDGRSAGLTVPNGPMQRSLIEEALADAGLSGADIDYLEAHGTGTPLGDPIELQAIAAALGEGRDREHPVLVASVKTNIGHLEAAAGVAGVIKVALSLHHGEIPPHLHLSEPSPYVAWDELPLRVPTALTPWPGRGTGARLAGISSFGFSGTNAHIVLEGASGPAAMTEVCGSGTIRPELLLLSARSVEALDTLADELAALLESGNAPPLSAVAAAAATRRSHHAQRIALVAHDREEAARELRGFSTNGEPRPGLRSGHAAPGDRPRLISVFCGHGAEWLGMGRDLLRDEPLFAEVLARCDELVRASAGWSVLGQLHAAPDEARLDDTEILQPVLFSLQAGMFELWRSLGVTPDAVVGHSVGEIAAAYAAGALTLADGLDVALARGRLMQPTKGAGAMAALGLSLDVALELVAGEHGAVAVAAHNGPATTVISGDAAAVDHLVDVVAARHHFARRLPGAIYPFHAGAMVPVREPLIAALGGLRPGELAIPMWSTVTGAAAGADELGAVHWGDGVVGPVRFSEALSAAAMGQSSVVLEIAPHPVLAGAIAQTLDASGLSAGVFATMTKDGAGRASILDALAQMHVIGAASEHLRRHPGPTSWVELPTYPWQRERHWVQGFSALSGDGLVPAGTSALQRRFDAVGSLSAHYFETDLADPRLAPIAEHRYCGVTVLPFSLGVSLMVAAARDVLGEEVALEELTIHDRMIVVAAPGKKAQVAVARAEGGARLEIWVTGADGPTHWASARAVPAATGAPRGGGDPAPGEHRVVAGLFDLFAAEGVSLGESWQIVDELATGNGESRAVIELASEPPDEAELANALVLGAAGFVLAACTADSSAPVALFVSRVRRLQIDPVLAGTLDLRVAWSDEPGGAGSGRATLTDRAGRVVAELEGVELARVGPPEMRPVLPDLIAALSYDIEWRPRSEPLSSRPGAPGEWLILLDEGGVGHGLAERLIERGARTSTLGAVAARDEGALERALEFASPEPLAGVVDLRWLDITSGLSGDVAATVRESCDALLTLSRALERRGTPGNPQLYVVTRGAEAVGDDKRELVVGAAGLWGLGRVLALEHPEFFARLIDLDPEGAADEVATLLAEVLSADDEEQVAWRGGERLLARLVCQGAPAAGAELRLSPDASYLVTGGRGALGRTVARWLVSRGARSIVLTGRSTLPERSTWDGAETDESISALIATVRELEGVGVAVHTPAADVTDRDAMAAIIAGSDGRWPAVRGIVHAAGSFELRAATATTTAELAGMLAPKVGGTLVLHELTRDLELDLFVMFSSAASVWGSALAAGYAAANHFEDTFAHFRHQLGLPALAVNWGWWAGGGMATPELQQYFREIGLGTLPADLALMSLERLVCSGTVQRTIAPVDWTSFKPVYEAKRRRHLLDLIEVAPIATTRRRRAHAAYARALVAAPVERRLMMLVESLQQEVGGVLGLQPGRRVDPTVGFFEAGMDSLMSVELQRRVQSLLGVSLPATAAFEHPSIEMLSEYLLRDVFQLDSAPVASSLLGRSAPAMADAPAHAEAELESLSEQALLQLLADEVESGRR